MTVELDRLKTEVAEISGVVDSAITTLQGLAQIIRDQAFDPAAMATLADALDLKAKLLSDAIVAVGPTPGVVVPEPAPVEPAPADPVV